MGQTISNSAMDEYRAYEKYCHEISEHRNTVRQSFKFEFSEVLDLIPINIWFPMFWFCDRLN